MPTALVFTALRSNGSGFDPESKASIRAREADRVVCAIHLVAIREAQAAR